MGRARGAPRGRLGGRASWCGIGAGRRRPIPAPYPRRAALLSLGRDAEKRYLASSRARCRGAASGGWRLTWHDWATAKTAAGSLTPALIPCAQVTHGAGREKRWPRPNETSLPQSAPHRGLAARPPRPRCCSLRCVRPLDCASRGALRQVGRARLGASDSVESSRRHEHCIVHCALHCSKCCSS